VFKGVTPAAGHAGRFAILLEPAPAGAIVRACMDGVCVVRVRVLNLNHAYAEAKAGEAAHLESAASGSVRLLWVESVTPPAAVYAVVRIGLPAAVPHLFLAVRVKKAGGDEGSGTVPCSLVYDVWDIVDQTMNPAARPCHYPHLGVPPRPNRAPQVMRSKSRQPRQSVCQPGSPSRRRARDPPSFATSRQNSYAVNVSAARPR